ncbi:DUF3649 domain-containing protein [Massilia sp. YIM B04103]|uniref:DUF3649 domain-containing protein n=1 Tax=Massilia sp. YIM B04103 TaxID=2963106 RepID=UPI00210EEF37|nr:DUF3649 domain-containing protein [Massilia sp. YIM B04103]
MKPTHAAASQSRSLLQALRQPHPTLSRTLAALVGGYLFASAAGVLLTALSLTPHESPEHAMLGGGLLGLAMYAIAITWAFATRSVRRAWAGLLIGSVLLVVPGLLLTMRGGAA